MYSLSHEYNIDYKSNTLLLKIAHIPGDTKKGTHLQLQNNVFKIMLRDFVVINGSLFCDTRYYRRIPVISPKQYILTFETGLEIVQACYGLLPMIVCCICVSVCAGSSPGCQ